MRWRVEMVSFVEAETEELAFELAYTRIADEQADEVWVMDVPSLDEQHQEPVPSS